MKKAFIAAAITLSSAATLPTYAVEYDTVPLGNPLTNVNIKSQTPLINNNGMVVLPYSGPADNLGNSYNVSYWLDGAENKIFADNVHLIRNVSSAAPNRSVSLTDNNTLYWIGKLNSNSPLSLYRSSLNATSALFDMDNILPLNEEVYFNASGQIAWMSPNAQFGGKDLNFWNSTNVKTISYVPANHQAPKLNNLGHVVWATTPASSTNPTQLWVHNGTYEKELISDNNYQGVSKITDYSINNNGEIAWTMTDASGSYAYLWSGNTATRLPDSANADDIRINDHGHVVWAIAAGGAHDPNTLGIYDGTSTQLVNTNDGPMLLEFSNNGHILWTNGGVTSIYHDGVIGTIENPNMNLADINDQGQVTSYQPDIYYTDQVILATAPTPPPADTQYIVTPLSAPLEDITVYDRPLLNNNGIVVAPYKGTADAAGNAFNFRVWADGNEFDAFTNNVYLIDVSYFGQEVDKQNFTDSNVVYWVGKQTSASPLTLYASDANSTTALLDLSGAPALESAYAINESGQMTWNSTNPANGSLDTYFWNGLDLLQLSDSVQDDFIADLNDNGQLAWSTAEPGAYSATQLWFYDGQNTIDLLANSNFQNVTWVSSPKINNLGHIAFALEDDSGLYAYLYDGNSINRLPNSAGAWDVYLNERDQVAWHDYVYATGEMFLKTYDGNIVKEIAIAQNVLVIDFSNNGHLLWRSGNGMDTGFGLYDGQKIHGFDNPYFARGAINDHGQLAWYLPGGIYGHYQVTLASPLTTNKAPIADAGMDSTIHVGGTAYLDGGNSNDPDGDALSYQWQLSAAPAGSTAMLLDPTSATPSFTPDLIGSYQFDLVVNDGTVDSPADSVTLTVVSANDAAGGQVSQLITIISEPQFVIDAGLANQNSVSVAVSKLSTVIGQLQSGDTQAALNQLTNDLLPKIDGCAERGVADGPGRHTRDWITDCDAQLQLYTPIMDAIAILR